MQGQRKKSMNWKLMIVNSVLALFLVGCGVMSPSEESTEGSPGETETTGHVDEEGNVTVSNVRVNVTSEITDAVKNVEGAVVSIINMQSAGQPNQWGFFGDEGESEASMDQGELEQAGTGSGVIYKQDGDTSYVVTNNHVVEGSDAVEVLFKDGMKVDAQVIGTDLWTDLAVLSISSENVTTVADFGDSDNLTVGEPAIAIGSPLGTNFASSVTSGIISAIGRSVPVDTNADGTVDWEMTAIQTDAAINPGNSGGALVNIAGQVIGINSMKISSNTVEGMGFAIPANDVVDIVNELESTGEVTRPVFGISLVDLTMISQQQQETVLRIPEEVEHGVVVAQVTENSAASNAGIQQYDVIVEFNGQTIDNSIELRKEIYDTEIGEEIEVSYYRQNELQTVTVVMQEASNEGI